MNPTTQERFRPLIQQRLAALELRLQEVIAPVEETAHATAVASATLTAATPAADTIAAVHSEKGRLQNALQRIDAGTYGRCIRCGYNLPVARLEQELDTITCDPCKPRRRNARTELQV